MGDFLDELGVINIQRILLQPWELRRKASKGNQYLSVECHYDLMILHPTSVKLCVLTYLLCHQGHKLLATNFSV